MVGTTKMCGTIHFVIVSTNYGTAHLVGRAKTDNILYIQWIELKDQLFLKEGKLKVTKKV